MKSYKRERIDKYFDKLWKENRELYWKLQCLCCCFIIARRANKNKVNAGNQDDVITDQPKNGSNDGVHVDEILHEGAEKILDDVEDEIKEQSEKRRRSRRESRRKDRRQDRLWG